MAARMARTLTALAAGALCSLVAATPAGAQAPSLGDFVLRKSGIDLTKRVKALDGTLRRTGVQQLLIEAKRKATHNGPCKAKTFENIPPGSQWYCFDPADAGEKGGQVEWIPQGVSTVADAQQDGLWGGRQAILVSWYDDAHAPKKGVRVSFLDPNRKRYAHVLLVYPYFKKRKDESDPPTYEIVGRPQGGIHAGGILWYGNYLYVVDTKRGIRVFDMRHIYDLERSSNGDTKDRKHIGWGERTLRTDIYRGFGYRYVMPQVDAWVNAAGPDNDDKKFRCKASGAPAFSSIALDRSEVPDRLITSQYCRTGDRGRVARWPLNGDTGQLQPSGDGRVHATEAYRLAKDQIQGAVSYDGTWYLSRSTGKTGEVPDPGELVVAKPQGAPTGVLNATDTRPAGRGPEDLSFWPAQNELWTVTEHARWRMLYGVPP